MASYSISQQLARSNQPSTSSSAAARPEGSSPIQSLWFSSTIVLFVVLVAFVAYSKWRLDKIKKELKFEQYKQHDLKEKLKLSLVTIRKMETNPDLVYAREFNLDYLRMRMDEDVFHGVILNQIKMKITQLVGELLRPDAAKNAVGVQGSARQIDSIFDITYETEGRDGKYSKGVLFRIRVKLKKLPTQASTTTIAQICECLVYFLSPSIQPNNWQPAIQRQLVLLDWDQKAKPTPLLILEQLDQGVSVFPWAKQPF